MGIETPWAVLWDVDGTLVDTAELHFQAWVVLAREIDKPYTRADFAATFGWRNPEIIPLLFGSEYTSSEVAELGQRKEDYYRAEAAKGVEPLPGVRALVEALSEAGFRQAIGSSAPRANVELILEMTGLGGVLREIVALEDTTRGKPDPQVFLKAAQKIGVPPERCLVFEDAPVGIRAAKSAGMKAVGVTFVAHHPADKLEAEGADRVVASLDEMNVAGVRQILAG